jgi:hypothetical protein
MRTVIETPTFQRQAKKLWSDDAERANMFPAEIKKVV